MSELAAQKKQKPSARESAGGRGSSRKQVAVAAGSSQEGRAWRLPRVWSGVWTGSKPKLQTLRFPALTREACAYLSRAQEFCSWKFQRSSNWHAGLNREGWGWWGPSKTSWVTASILNGNSHPTPFPHHVPTILSSQLSIAPTGEWMIPLWGKPTNRQIPIFGSLHLPRSTEVYQWINYFHRAAGQFSGVSKGHSTITTVFKKGFNGRRNKWRTWERGNQGKETSENGNLYL